VRPIDAREEQGVTEVSPQEWGNRYRAIRGTCVSLTARLRALIVDLLAEANIEVIQIEARTKAIDSFTEKISRKRVKYVDRGHRPGGPADHHLLPGGRHPGR